MDNPSLTPNPDPPSILGSRRRDGVVGVLIGIAWWVAGVPLMVVSQGGLFPLLLIAYVGQLVYLGRRKGGWTMLATILGSTVSVPVIAFLGLLGMCGTHRF